MPEPNGDSFFRNWQQETVGTRIEAMQWFIKKGTSMNSITVAELALWRQSGFEHRLIDVRRAEKRASDACAISSAEWLDPSGWLDWKDTVPGASPVIVYCAHGHEISQGLTAALRALGLDARSLDGGIQAWRDAGQSVESL